MVPYCSSIGEIHVGLCGGINGNYDVEIRMDWERNKTPSTFSPLCICVQSDFRERFADYQVFEEENKTGMKAYDTLRGSRIQVSESRSISISDHLPSSLILPIHPFLP